MREEHEERLIKDAERVAREQKEEELKAQEAQEVSERPRKETGFVAVCAGTGLADIFKGIGADVVIEGGQTMNPSTEDILKAVEQASADTVYVLPNNKNIILAAEQAKKLSEDCQVVVVPSKTIPQGITALINFAPESGTPGKPGDYGAGDGTRKNRPDYLCSQKYFCRWKRDP